MARRGYIYRGQKPVYWCAHCETALAEAEIEYHDHRSPSVYFTFQVVTEKVCCPTAKTAPLSSSWTTTPWTIPANMAVALHPELSYVLVDTDRGKLLMAEELVGRVAEETGVVSATCSANGKARSWKVWSRSIRSLIGKARSFSANT